MKKDYKINFNKFINNINSIESKIDNKGGEKEEQISKKERYEFIFNCCLILNNDLEINDNLINYFTRERLDNFYEIIEDYEYYNDKEENIDNILKEIEKGYSLKDLLFDIKSTVVPNSILFF